jgi:molybdopterin-containing oxidoreductase family iron-sulfur binding subunit
MSDISKSKDKLWKSPEDLNDNPETMKSKNHEFADGVEDQFDPSKLSAISRRKFFALLSASAALTVTACTNYHDNGEIISYNKKPEGVIPGIANYYASTCNGCEQSCGILIKTREGRPIKVDGNPDHPVNKGKICSKGQAGILNLYDPERLRDPLISGKKSDWKTVDNEIIVALNKAQKNGQEIAVITGTITSPTTKKVLDDFVSKYSTAKIYSYSLISDRQRRDAWQECYGTEDYPSIKWNEAEVILSLDADFLGNEGSFIENMRKYTSKREVFQKTDFNRLYVLEGRMSVTGMMADYRFRISPDQQFNFVMSLINELYKHNSKISLGENIKAKLANYSISKYENIIGKEKLNHLINDLIKNAGKSIVYAGETLPKEAHIAVNLLNEILGSTALYDYSSSFKTIIKQSGPEEISQLVDSMNNGKVSVVIHFDSNPVFTLPDDYGYASALKKVNTVISFTEEKNETSAAAGYTIPISHTFESWGDANIRTGVYSLQQPVIEPIFNTRQKEIVLLTWIAGDANSFNPDLYHNYLMNSFNSGIYSKRDTFADVKTFWYSALHDGVVLTNEITQPNKFNLSALDGLKDNYSRQGYTVQLVNNYFIGDGKYANNGWLQELPHPVTKVTWDNYASISPSTAQTFGTDYDELIEIKLGDNKLTLPVFIQPGMADNLIAIELGYGRKVTGDVGKEVGFNSVSLMSKRNNDSSYIFQNANVKKVNGTHKLVTTQEHHSLNDTVDKDFHLIRKIIQEGTVEQYKKQPDFLNKEKGAVPEITRKIQYTGNKWGMVIDLNKCTGCTACITSCNVENNIVVVGKEQVEKSREMQWIRLDRYYSGTPDDPIVSNQPMLCMHCDDAPCENVCPVDATNHSPDGLNQMVYNRCVGTRYCSNNCPYKVRRFNFFNYRDHFADSYYDNDLAALTRNPEVTVRSRGVMEKCTFCIQKIMEAKSDAVRDGKQFKGSDVVTACQQACPTNAITFGDTNDPESKVAKLRDHNLSYHVLEELNVKPNVTYIAKLRNVDSETGV